MNNVNCERFFKERCATTVRYCGHSAPSGQEHVQSLT